LGEDKYITARNGKVGFGKVEDGKFKKRKNVEGDMDFWIKVFKGLCHHREDLANCLPFRYMVKSADFSGDQAKGYFLTGVWYGTQYRIDLRFLKIDPEGQYQFCRGGSLTLRELHNFLLFFPQTASLAVYPASDALSENLMKLSDLLLRQIDNNVRDDDEKLLHKLSQEGLQLMHPKTYDQYLAKENVKNGILARETIFFAPYVVAIASGRLLNKNFCNEALNRAQDNFDLLVVHGINNEEGAFERKSKLTFFSRRARAQEEDETDATAVSAEQRDS
jgi:hypothetical protein